MKYQTADGEAILKELSGWEVIDNQLVKTFTFKNYFTTIAFVNAIAWICQKAKHHPDLNVHYGKVIVKFTTHDKGNVLTSKDFDCAKQVESLERGVLL